MNLRILMAKLCYRLGDRISRPMCERDWGWLYPVYARLMCWSDALDNRNVVWGPRK